jgi:predicted nuclease with TOPRIM domain
VCSSDLRTDQGAAIREELRKEIEGLREQLNRADIEEQRLEKMVDEWRAKYYDLRDEKQKVVTELTIVMERLKAYERAIADQRLDNPGTS